MIPLLKDPILKPVLKFSPMSDGRLQIEKDDDPKNQSARAQPVGNYLVAVQWLIVENRLFLRYADDYVKILSLGRLGKTPLRITVTSGTDKDVRYADDNQGLGFHLPNVPEGNKMQAFAHYVWGNIFAGYWKSYVGVPILIGTRGSARDFTLVRILGYLPTLEGYVSDAYGYFQQIDASCVNDNSFAQKHSLIFAPGATGDIDRFGNYDCAAVFDERYLKKT